MGTLSGALICGALGMCRHSLIERMENSANISAAIGPLNVFENQKQEPCRDLRTFVVASRIAWLLSGFARGRRGAKQQKTVVVILL